MTETMLAAGSFAAYEREGWQRNAADYDTLDLPVTAQAIGPLLDSLGDLRGVRLLEIACGTGHLARAARVRGAAVVGIDFASNMVNIARRLVPDATFSEGDAEALSFEDRSFDRVVCCFSLLHMEHPDRAIREAARVLTPGGTFAFTVWYGPDKGSDFMRALLGAYQRAQADLDVGLPPAPPMFALSDPEVHTSMLKQAGFETVSARNLDVVWPLRGPETVLEFALKGAVRSRMLYERQKADVQQRIREAWVEASRPYVAAGRDGIPCPAVLVAARVPG